MEDQTTNTQNQIIESTSQENSTLKNNHTIIDNQIIDTEEKIGNIPWLWYLDF